MKRYEEGLEELEEETEVDPREGEPRTPCLPTPEFSRPKELQKTPPPPPVVKEEMEDLERVPQHLIQVARK